MWKRGLRGDGVAIGCIETAQVVTTQEAPQHQKNIFVGMAKSLIKAEFDFYDAELSLIESRKHLKDARNPYTEMRKELGLKDLKKGAFDNPEEGAVDYVKCLKESSEISVKAKEDEKVSVALGSVKNSRQSVEVARANLRGISQVARDIIEKSTF